MSAFLIYRFPSVRRSQRPAHTVIGILQRNKERTTNVIIFPCFNLLLFLLLFISPARDPCCTQPETPQIERFNCCFIVLHSSTSANRCIFFSCNTINIGCAEYQIIIVVQLTVGINQMAVSYAYIFIVSLSLSLSLSRSRCGGVVSWQVSRRLEVDEN